jgi:hypothetical protein
MPNVTVCINTCRRLALFRRTFESFLDCCKDLDVITTWLVADNGSSLEDVAAMEQMPFLAGNIVSAGNRTRGQLLTSMFRAVLTPYLFFLEDDWLFTKTGHPIRLAQEIMRQDERIRLVGLKYWNCPIIEGPLPYRLHEYVPYGAQGERVDTFWPGYTFNPSLQATAAVQALLPFTNVMDVERDAAERFHAAGHRVAHTVDDWVQHIGDGQSAYSITGRPR